MSEISRQERRVRQAAFAAVFIYLAITLFIAAGLLSRTGEPFSGLFISHKGYVGLKLLAAPELDLAATPIAFDDRLVSLDDEPVANTRAFNARLAELGVGHPVRYGFSRSDGSFFEIAAPVVPLTARLAWTGIFPMMIAGTAGMLAAFAILLAQPRSLAARVFFVASWGCSLQFSVLPFDTFLAHRLLPWSQLAGIAAFGGLFHLGLCFPEPRWPMTKHPKFGSAAIYGVASIPWLWAIVRHDWPHSDFDTFGRGLYVPALTFLSLPVAANALWTMFGSGTDDLRTRARLAMPIVLVITGTAVIHQIWNLPTIPLETRIAISVGFSTVGAITFMFVAIRNDIFDIPSHRRRAITRAFLIAAGVISYLVLHAVVQRFAGMGSAWATGVIATALFLGLVLTVRPFRARFEAGFEDLVFPGQRGSRIAVRELAKDLAGTRKPSEIAPLVRNAIDRCMGESSPRILVHGSDTGLVEISCPDWVEELSSSAIRAAAVLFALRRPIHLDRREEEIPQTIRDAADLLRASGFCLAVSLPEGGAIGGFLLAGRSNEKRYVDSEIEFLETLAGQSAVALENARAREENRSLQRRLSERNLYLKQEIREGTNASEIVGESRVLRELLAQVGQVASTSATVLITGETGTGKELIARAIHAASDRAGGSLVKLACGAIPVSLFESELFGHERGAFTGAGRRRLGRFEVAEGGTLFLDDVDALPLSVQAKLLRVLQDGEIQRLGSNDVRYVDVRIIAATNKDLAEEVSAGNFREDLFYRLNVVPVAVPALKDRREDIPLLVHHFIAVKAKKHERQIDEVSRSALDEMQGYAWPGNIRELRNVIERTIVLSHEPVFRLLGPLEPIQMEPGSCDDEAFDGSAPNEELTLENRVRDFKSRLIEKTLRSVGGNHRLAAERLGIHRPSLTRLVGRLGIRLSENSDSK